MPDVYFIRPCGVVVFDIKVLIPHLEWLANYNLFNINVWFIYYKIYRI